jgi:adenosylcobinamide-phosphate synthase
MGDRRPLPGQSHPRRRMSWTALAHPPDTLPILALALALEAAAGYPDALYRAVGHPVTWIGRLIGALDRHLNRGSATQQRVAGIASLLILIAIVGGAALAASALACLAGPLGGLVIVAIACASLPAQRSLHDHVARVAAGLRRDGLAGGRREVAMIVGRDPESLDEAGICRAAIESLSENFSDGIVAPAVWIGIGGLAGGVLYKAINTADSMIGHRTPRHEDFGWASARLDDLVNLPASRLSAGLIIAAAACHRGASASGAWRAVRRDAGRHRSPNAGWPEAAMAGALGLRLAGPRVYGAVRVEDAWMGDGRAEAGPEDVERALALYRTACLILFFLAAVGGIAAIA